MTAIYQALGYPLGWIMWALYNIVRNYGIALLIFTVLIRVVLFPLSLKQQKSSAKMMVLQPQIADLQSRYKNDKQKLNEEMMKLYQREKYNPMSGCLPLLIQMPVLFGLIDVIYRPLTHILRFTAETVGKGIEVLESAGNFILMPGLNQAQLQIISGVHTNPDAFAGMGRDAIAAIQGLSLTFLGMDLTLIPNMSMFSDFNAVILIPILSGGSALLSTIQMQRQQAITNPNANTGMMKGMMYMMPIFSVWIAFSVPAGVGLYWFYSNLTQMGQTLIMNKIYNPREIAEKAKQALEEQKERERLERIEAKKKRKEENTTGKAKGGGEKDEAKNAQGLTQKEINRKKLADARRRDAEKYGETYVEVTDEDLI
ncbi:MAG: membrane protein insertase YidC [Oscillospiraceae bacterium]|nr:membrane protein insertase YidC [Oscillospiraceae bacterium]